MRLLKIYFFWMEGGGDLGSLGKFHDDLNGLIIIDGME